MSSFTTNVFQTSFISKSSQNKIIENIQTQIQSQNSFNIKLHLKILHFSSSFFNIITFSYSFSLFAYSILFFLSSSSLFCLHHHSNSLFCLSLYLVLHTQRKLIYLKGKKRAKKCLNNGINRKKHQKQVWVMTKEEIE